MFCFAKRLSEAWGFSPTYMTEVAFPLQKALQRNANLNS